MIILKLSVFHQTTPPGHIRDILEPFSFLSKIQGVMYILKRLPGVPDTGKLQFSGIPDTRELQLPGVPDTRELQLINFLKISGVRDSGESQIAGVPDT